MAVDALGCLWDTIRKVKMVVVMVQLKPHLVFNVLNSNPLLKAQEKIEE